MSSSTEPDRKLDYDEVMSYIGQFGSFQRRIFFWLWIVSAGAGLAVVVFGFTAFTPKHRVRTECDTADSTYYLNDNGDLPAWLTALNNQAEDDDLKLKNNDCRIPTVTKNASGVCVSAFFTKDNAELSDSPYPELIIDRSIMKSSLVEEYSFFCNRSWIRSLYSAIYMLGMLVGSYLFGFLSDTFGRVKALMLAIIFVSIAGFIGAFCTGGSGGEYGYAVFRFITGMGGIGCFMVCFVIAVEHVGAKFTMLIGIAIEIPFALGEAFLGIEALIFRHWQTLQIVAYLPLLAMIGLWFVVPEPARWLLAKGRVADAQKVIRKAADTNGRKVPAWMLAPEKVEAAQAGADLGQQQKSTNVLDLFNTRLMATRTLNMCFQWFSVTMCYYGLTNASTSLSDNPFGNFMLSCLIEIPGDLFCIVFMDVWGRRPILSFCQIVSGVSCVIVGLLSGLTDNTLGLQIFLSLIGKFCAAASFAIVYVYTAEMFPTSIRNQAVGVCSLVARIGGVTSLLLDLLKDLWQPAPVFIMGCVATCAGFLALLFPETLGEKLPDTLEEAKRIGEKSRRGICECSFVSPLKMYKEELKDAE